MTKEIVYTVEEKFQYITIIGELFDQFGTLYNFSHESSDLSCSKHHSMAISYSIVLGWEQCEVDTASLWAIKPQHTNKGQWKYNLRVEVFNICEYVCVCVGVGVWERERE